MSSKRELARARRHRDTAMEILAQLTDGVLADLIRRGEQTSQADGYPSDSMPEFVTGGGGVTVTDDDGEATVSLTSVETAVEARVYDRPPRDNVADALNELLASLAELAGVAVSVQRRHDFLDHVSEKTRGRVASIGECQRCQAPCAGGHTDRLKAGFCPACYTAWLRAGRPDRFAFVRDYEPLDCSQR